MKKVDKPFATINYNGYIYTIIKKQINICKTNFSDMKLFHNGYQKN